MADIQIEGAKVLLDLIASHLKKTPKLTYSEAAKLMGRTPPEAHSKAVAQMCDLLDAAACFAGVPLLALVEVREKSGGINKEAWKNEYGPRRDAIINRSQRYRFKDSDFNAISKALDDLSPRGNRAAWKHLRDLYPGDLCFRRLMGQYTDESSDAIDDLVLGGDLGAECPDRAKSEVWSYTRDPKVRAFVLQRANGKCEYCGSQGFVKPDGSYYLETHHVIALAKDGKDKVTNVIALCANDHREAHFGKKGEEIEMVMLVKLKQINTHSKP